MRCLVPLFLGLVLTGCDATVSRDAAAPPIEPAASIEALAAALAREAIVVDTHIDLPYRLHAKEEDVTQRTEGGHFDAVRARAGGLDVAFMSIYVPSDLGEGQEAFHRAEELIDLVERLVERSPDVFALARTPAEARAAAARDLIALPLGMENGSALGTALANLRHFHDRGIRYVTLTHATNNQLADSSYATEDRWSGLSPFGREVVAEMNRLGMMIDVSHLADEAAAQAIELSRAPVIASHSSVRGLTPGFERNLSDELIRALAEGGGVVQVNFGSAFVTAAANAAAMAAWEAARRFATEQGVADDSPEAEAFGKRWKEENPIPAVTVADVADHFDHVVELVGIDHVGLGSDYDGVSDLPVDLGDVSTYPALFTELLRRGYSEEDVRKIAGENLLRVWDEVERLAER
jgi:membrane dipeptidase